MKRWNAFSIKTKFIGGITLVLLVTVVSVVLSGWTLRNLRERTDRLHADMELSQVGSHT